MDEQQTEPEIDARGAGLRQHAELLRQRGSVSGGMWFEECFSWGFDEIPQRLYETIERYYPHEEYIRQYIPNAYKTDQAARIQELEKENQELRDRLTKAVDEKELDRERLAQEINRAALTILKHFSEENPELLTVYFESWKGRSQREIARDMGCSVGKVNGLLKKVREIADLPGPSKHENPYPNQLNMEALLRYQTHPLSPVNVPTADEIMQEQADAKTDGASSQMKALFD